MDKEQVTKLLLSIERTALTGQDMARGYMDRDPAHGRHNIYYRTILQDIRDIRKALDIEA
jgi:hypothetical protein